MIRVFDRPEYMTVKQAEQSFHPNSVIMINCEMEMFAPIAGYVVATETLGGEDYEELDAYRDALQRDTKNGEVFLLMTSDPYVGEGLFVGQNF